MRRPWNECCRALLALTVASLAGCSPAPKWTDAGPEQWQQVGPCAVAVESVRVGKVKVKGVGLGGEGESKEDLLVIKTRFRNQDDKLTVKYIPWQNDRMPITIDLSLADDRGQSYKPVVAFGLWTTVEGRPGDDVIVKAADPPVSDLLTFEAKAAQANVLLLEMPAKWMEQDPAGWRIKSEGKFRFRIPREMWQAGK
jgi:hypothetical protein